MKKALKKIVAVTMAFTLLGTGISMPSKSVYTLNTHAASGTCMHSTARCGSWYHVQYLPLTVEQEVNGQKVPMTRTYELQGRNFRDYCPKCGITFGTGVEHRVIEPSC